MSNSLQQAAATFIKPNGSRHALSIFPLQVKGKFPAIPKNEGGKGCLDASKDAAQIEKWWTRFPQANIGIATGKINGIVVIDVDIDPEKDIDGNDGLKELEKKLGKLPDTWEAITGRGGRHLYFKYPEGHVVKNSASSIAQGVDVRGDGGYVVAPPSIHQTGKEYMWEAGSYPHETKLASLPDKWVALLESKAGTAKNTHSGAQNTGDRFSMPDAIPEGQRNKTLFSFAASMRSRCVPASDIMQQLAQANLEKCKPPLDMGDITRIYNSAMRYKEGTDAKEMKLTEQDQPNNVKPADFSDAGNAVSFFRCHRGSLLWCDALGWLVWDGTHWDTNEHAATEKAINFSEAMLQDAFKEYSAAQALDDSGKITVPEAVKAYMNHARKTRSRSSIFNFMELSKAWFAIKAAELDAQPFLLNTPSGAINLQTGEVTASKPEQLCTRITATCPSDDGGDVWQNFLDLITEKDTDLQNYLQVAIGSCSIGTILHEGIWVAVGGGRNGKSTFYNAISHVLGDYAGSIDSTVLTTEKQNRGASLATLRGKRFVTCGELEEGQRLSVQTLKRIAATDDLTIEKKYMDPETIKPSHHINLFSNFLPRVGSTDNGTWRRLNVIPFNAVMPEGNSDIPNYAQVLYEKAGGAILAWIIKGAYKFIVLGNHLPNCKKVQEATDDYRNRENWIQLFLSERCVRENGANIRCGELYTAYKVYAQESGDYVRRLADFNAAMESAGFHQISKQGNRKYWTGIRLDLDYPSGGVGCAYYSA